MSEEPIPLADSLSGVVRSLRGPGRDGRTGSSGGPTGGTPVPSASMLGGVFGRWDDVVGEAVARHVQPIKLDGDRLVVEVDDPAWATQLRFLESSLLERLAAVLGDGATPIRSFEIRVGRPR